MSFRITAGDTKIVAEQLMLEGNKYTPPAGANLIFTVKRLYTDPDGLAIFQKTTGAGITTTGSVASITIVRADTFGIDPGPYYYDIQSQHTNGDVHGVGGGTASILPDITSGLDTSIPIYTTQPSATANAADSAATALTAASEAAASAAAAAQSALDASGAAGGSIGVVATDLANEIIRATAAEAAAIVTAGEYTDAQLASEVIARDAAIAAASVDMSLYPLKSNNLSDLQSVSTAKTNLGLGNVDNTSDVNKPISSATGTALSGKQPIATVLTNTTASFTSAQETKLSGIATGATVNSTDATLLNRSNHTGTQSADTLTDGTTNKAFLATERTKLAAISGTNTGDQDLSGLFKLDQTIPQTVINGTPIFNSLKLSTSPDTNNALEIVNGVGGVTLSITGEGLVSGISPRFTWIGLVTGAVPTGPTAVTGGEVYTYNYGSTARYRFINTTGTTDEFYANFDGTNVTTLIVSKALQF